MPHKTTSLIPQKTPGYAISCLSWLPLPFVSIRVHSCPFVVQNMPEPRGFVCFVFFVVNHCLSCPFVPIRGSYSLSFPSFFVVNLCLSRPFVPFRGSYSPLPSFFVFFAQPSHIFMI